jgi:benzoate-CoA ligase
VEAFNLADHFVDRHLREGRGDKVAVLCGPRQLTYANVAELVNRAGSGLLAAGLQEEQRVLIVLPDLPEFAAAYFGAMKAGAVAVPTSTALRSADYAYFLSESRARAAVVHSSIIPEFAPALDGQRHAPKVIVCGERVTGYLHWDDFVGNSSSAMDAPQTGKDDAAFWLWTSGSTGRPKAAVHLHHDWVHCCESYARRVLGIGPHDRTFSTSKLFHAYGLGNGLMFPFHVGATTVLFPDRPQPKPILEAAAASRPTLFFSVPTLYAAMLQHVELGNEYELSSVRLAASAAEPLPAEIYRRWKDRFGIEILDGIGSTEVLHIYISSRSGNVRAGSTGQAVPGYELALIDNQGRPVAPGTIGDLLVSGASTAQCYWNRQELSRERMRGRWFFTGDKYSVDADGFYWYSGRSDDMFRVSGQWVSPAEVEGTLAEHPCVLESAVVAYEEETLLHTPKAYVVLRETHAASPALVRELQDFVKSRISPHNYPRRIEFLEELPKTAAGKVLRYKLREMNRRTEASAAQTSGD